MKIIHIIPTLGSGGAENMLYKLLKHSDKDLNNIEIVTFSSEGFYTNKIRDLGITIHELETKGLLKFFKIFFDLIKILKSADIVHSWMYHSNLLAFVFGKLILRKKVIWSIRRSYIGKKNMKKKTYYIAKYSFVFSKYVDCIVSCTKVGKKNHKKMKYQNSNFIVIPNGFEMKMYNQKNEKTKNKKINILNVARWEVLKDHKTLLKTAKIIKENNIDFNLKLVGNNIDDNNVVLTKLIKDGGLVEEIELLGIRRDIPELMNSSDIYVSSSISEGFPNVIGEAMASNLFCIATDAGDTKYILGGNGIVVPVGDAERLAKGILEYMKMENNTKEQAVVKARKRVEDKFSIEKIVQQYEQLYHKIYYE